MLRPSGVVLLLPLLCLVAGCTTVSTPDYSDGTYLGTLSRSGRSCDAPSAPATTGTFVVTKNAAGNVIDVELAGALACEVVAPGEDDLLDGVDAPPSGCLEPPTGFTFSSGSFNYGDTPAQLLLSWTQGTCTVDDLWSMTRQ